MRLLRALFLPICLIVLVAGAFVVPLPVFLEIPDRPVPLVDRVDVGAAGAGPIRGEYLLSAVSVQRATTARLALALLEEGVGLLPERQLIPPGVEDEAFFTQQRAVFALAADTAAAVGLRAAGLPADPEAVDGDGALVVRVLPEAPAAEALEPNDVIVGLDGQPVRTAEELRTLVPSEPGELTLTVQRGGDEQTVRVRTAQLPGQPQALLGVQAETFRPRIELPVPVSVESGRIGGPSAGLVIAVLVYDLVSGEDLAAGRRIAGTGALEADGGVRPVGAVPPKVHAASEDGADVFLVPASQRAAAAQALPADSGMEVIGAATFEEALRALGGEPAQRARTGRRGRAGALVAPAAPLRAPAAAAYTRRDSPWPLPGGRAARPRATSHREPGQGRKAAAISGMRRVPRVHRAVSPVRS